MNKNCQEAKDLLAVAESGDSKTAAYRRAAEKIEKAISEDGLTQRQVAEEIGKDQKYVTRLLAALRRTRLTKNGEFVVDWESGSNKRADVIARQDKIALASELMADPQVVSTLLEGTSKAASNVRVGVSKLNSKKRHEAIERENRKREATAMPIGSIFTEIADKLDEWSRAMMEIEGDLVEAGEQFGASIVVTALRMHADTCNRIADRMELDTAVVIESTR